MTEAVGACALVFVAYVATRPRSGAPLWTLPHIKYPLPRDTRIRHTGDVMPIRRHDGSGLVWPDVPGAAFVAPPRVPEPTPEPEREPDPSPSTPDTDALRLDLMEARLRAWLDTEYVALCARMQVEPVAVTNTVVKHEPMKGTTHGDNSNEQHGSARQTGGLLARAGVDRGAYRARTRRRGLRVA